MVPRTSSRRTLTSLSIPMNNSYGARCSHCGHTSSTDEPGVERLEFHTTPIDYENGEFGLSLHGFLCSKCAGIIKGLITTRGTLWAAPRMPEED